MLNHKFFSYFYQQENHDALIRCLMEDKRFDKKRSAAAYIVYKSLIQWHSFEAEKTNIFDRIIHTIRSNVEVLWSDEWLLWFYIRMALNYYQSQTVEFEFTVSCAQNQENIGELAYWLSTTSTLLFLLQNTLKLSSASRSASNRRPSSSVSLFGRMGRVSKIFQSWKKNS